MHVLVFTEVEVEFTNSIYTTNEADTEVEVCVSVVSGQLGANITLQLDSVSETARGECANSHFVCTLGLSAATHS